MLITPDEIRKIEAEADLICDAQTVQQGLDRMAKEINEQLKDKNPLCICVLTGGIIAVGQLLPRLNFPLQLDTVHVSRYRGTTRGRDLQWKKPPEYAVQDRTLLIIDDILDEGLTLKAIVDYCRNAGAKEVYTAVLADKPQSRHPNGIQKADFTAVDLPSRYVFGFGLDYKDYLRNANGIFAVKGL